MRFFLLFFAFFLAAKSQIIEETIPDIEDDDYVDTVRLKKNYKIV